MPSIARADAIDVIARELAYGWQLAEIQESLARFNVHFDVWFSERQLHTATADGPSPIDGAVDRLRAQGHVFDEDDAYVLRRVQNTNPETIRRIRIREPRTWRMTASFDF